MSDLRRHREIPEQHRAQEHLANERTFLAWVRTSIALISLGFVLARVLPFLRQIYGGGRRLTNDASLFGISLVAFGALLTLLSAWRYDSVNREIESGLVKTDRGLVWFVTIVVALISTVLIVYMLLVPNKE